MMRIRRQSDIDGRLAGLVQRAIDDLAPDERWRRYTAHLARCGIIINACPRHLPSSTGRRGGVGLAQLGSPEALKGA